MVRALRVAAQPDFVGGGGVHGIVIIGDVKDRLDVLLELLQLQHPAVGQFPAHGNVHLQQSTPVSSHRVRNPAMSSVHIFCNLR